MNGIARSALLAAVMAACPCPSAWAQGDSFTETVYQTSSPAARLALYDVNGDGRLDLLDISPWGIRCHYLAEDGSYPEDVGTSLRWPSDQVGWDLTDMDGDGATEVVLLVEGNRVVVHRPNEAGAWDAGEVALEGASGWLPRGIRRMRIVRDVDGDGRIDLVLPAVDRYLIHLQQPDGGWSDALHVRFDASIGLEVGDPDRLDGEFGQDVVIPWFELQDVDGDGRLDLITERNDEVLVHLASPDLPAEPTWRLDLAELRESAESSGRINLEDLFSNIEPEAHWRVADLDGKPPLDLVLQVGGLFRLYIDGSRGPQLHNPDQVLKASGNVLWFVLRDTDGDGMPDLQIVRAERISIGTVLRWLVLAGSLDFEIFTYRNQGGQFVRKPSTRKRISLHIPAILSFVDKIQEMETEFEQRRAIPAGVACLDGDGVFNDVVDLSGTTVVFFHDRAPADLGPDVEARVSRMGNLDELLEAAVLEDLDKLEQGGTHAVGVKDLYALMDTPGYRLRQAIQGVQPDIRRAIPFATVDGPGPNTKMVSVGTFKLALRDLNGDGISDVIVTSPPSKKTRRQVQFLVMRP